MQKLSQIPGIKEVPNFSSSAQSYLESIIHDFDKDDALEVKKIEKVTNHDVKAVEYFLKQKCKSNPEIAKVFFLLLFLMNNIEVSFLCLHEPVISLNTYVQCSASFFTIVISTKFLFPGT